MDFDEHTITLLVHERLTDWRTTVARRALIAAAPRRRPLVSSIRLGLGRGLILLGQLMVGRPVPRARHA